MAKTLSEKSRIIRVGLTTHPELGNTELAKKLGDKHPALGIRAADVANQKQLLKKQGPSSVDEDEDEEESAQQTPAKPEPHPGLGLKPEDMEVLRELVLKVGGVDALIRWLEIFRDFAA